MSVSPVLVKMYEHDPNTGFNKPIRKAHVFCVLTRKYYIISENKDLDEALVFNSNAEGAIVNWHEVCGGKTMTVEEVLSTWDPAGFIKYDDDGDRIF